MLRRDRGAHSYHTVSVLHTILLECEGESVTDRKAGHIPPPRRCGRQQVGPRASEPSLTLTIIFHTRPGLSCILQEFDRRPSDAVSLTIPLYNICIPVVLVSLLKNSTKWSPHFQIILDRIVCHSHLR